MRRGHLLTIVHGGTRNGNLVTPRRVFYHLQNAASKVRLAGQMFALRKCYQPNNKKVRCYSGIVLSNLERGVAIIYT